jgi:hypothetical protein
MGQVTFLPILSAGLIALIIEHDGVLFLNTGNSGPRRLPLKAVGYKSASKVAVLKCEKLKKLIRCFSLGKFKIGLGIFFLS